MSDHHAPTAGSKGEGKILLNLHTVTSFFTTEPGHTPVVTDRDAAPTGNDNVTRRPTTGVKSKVMMHTLNSHIISQTNRSNRLKKFV